MTFNVDTLFEFAFAEIKKFALAHQNETFYSFAIDENLLCLNSIEEAEKTLRQYQNNWELKNRYFDSWDALTDADHHNLEYLLRLAEDYSGLDRSDKNACLTVINDSLAKTRNEGNPYLKSEAIASLYENTGDWSYQGFASMTEADGFDNQAYDSHYNSNDLEQATSEYAIAMNTLIERLVKSGVFDCLKQSDNFKAQRVEHNY